MNKTLSLIATIILISSAAYGQDEEERRWGIQLSIGGTEMNNSGSTLGEDQGNSYALTADWYVMRHLALTGGLYTEHTGLLTYLDADGIGPKTFNILGVMAGAKLYPLPYKWAIQPYIGVAAYTNVLNLSHQRGKFTFNTNYGADSPATVDYDVRCAPLSLAPQFGVDIRLLSSVSLNLAADYRYSLGGRSSAQGRITSGQMAGQAFVLDERHDRMVFSIGVKVDFPLRPINTSRFNDNLWLMIGSWLSTR